MNRDLVQLVDLPDFIYGIADGELSGSEASLPAREKINIYHVLVWRKGEKGKTMHLGRDIFSVPLEWLTLDNQGNRTGPEAAHRDPITVEWEKDTP